MKEIMNKAIKYNKKMDEDALTYMSYMCCETGDKYDAMSDQPVYECKCQFLLSKDAPISSLPEYGICPNCGEHNSLSCEFLIIIDEINKGE